ncbi:flavin reductase (DIM6/NTAB) family NADH-FMN oxidoreductase RutF [Pseudaminobacter salicylatoxidans]|uniref:Flavin reductase (DIM6/NTAB) family NADH-FMN oxidoreductase RutF n=1 Tax=Pseudaminobacter salicylatoxidans TaxID=93369 RepID=A0A316C457_PSESE|nr:flavin reductase family protein [Pseudaminobacter salicylatoxidans]PWJ84542.1 flavin reductase (DIM6/NTAB) family NADH-FMN oxidoreductase RutF [Pseudaminobacter salicylatoxidans]
MTTMAPVLDAREFRNACGGFSTGVTVISTRCGEGDHAMTANAFMSISLDPPLIAISLADTARMLPRLRAAGAFAVSVLREDMEDIAWHFAGKPRFEGPAPFIELGGLPVIGDAASVFVADVHSEVAAGDHVIVIGHVHAMQCDPYARPLVFHGGRFASLPAMA